MKVFTLGYQGLSLDLYTTTLLEAGIGVILDVREKAWSYNRRYIKGVMANALAESGIRYEHLRACGNPSENRKTAKSMEECLDRYRGYLFENPDCLDLLYDEITDAYDAGRPACLTCFEREPDACHRSILLQFLTDRHKDLVVTHLDIDPSLKTAVVPSAALGTTAQLL